MKKTLTAVAAAALLAASFQIGAHQNTSAEARTRPNALFTQEERNEFREKMRAAQTDEQRAEIRNQMRAATEQRAREKGVTLPQRHEAGGGPRHADHHGHGQAGPQLLSAEERTAFRERMRSSQTAEERGVVRKEMHGAMEQRAKEKGMTLPRGHGGHHHAQREGNRPQLFTPEERTQYRDNMHTAKTPEERTALRKQMRELSEQRAKERGVTLPERHSRSERSKGPGAPAKS